jgi:CubicO group peptidase (beta-lactamase class C family)
MGPVVLAAFAALSLNACRRSQAESQTARVDGLFASWNGRDTPGCAVGISRNGAIVYEHGYGMANLELSVPITPATVFHIASISKSFTAMSIMLAAEHGQLSLDDEVQKFVPEWVDRDDHITIRHLLAHTSGLRDAFGLLGWAAPSESAGDQNEAIVKILARQRGLNFPPGTDYQYNNGGYNLLGSIVKRATGQSLRVFADANIFKPLGMTHTHVHDDPTMLVSNRASGYSRDVNGWHLALSDNQGVIGNAGMQSTVGDLLLWAQNFDNPRVGTPATLAAMQKPTALIGGRVSTYGFGLGIGRYRGLQTIGHNGGDYGIATSVSRYPGQRFAVVVLCNIDSYVMGGTTTVNPDALTNGIADIYLADALERIESSSDTAPSPPASLKLSDAELSGKAGLYRLVGRDLPVLLSVSHGALVLRSYYQDDSDFEVTPVGANQFLFQNRVLLEFVPAAGGRPQEWHVGEGKDQGLWQLVTFAPSAAEIRSYAGDYRSDEIGVTYTVDARDTALVVKSTGRPDVTIAPFSTDVFVGDGVGIVKFSRDDRGATTGFTVNRDNARDVRFDRVK